MSKFDEKENLRTPEGRLAPMDKIVRERKRTPILIVSTILIFGIFIYLGFRRNQGQAPSLKNANYLGTCFICKCLREVPHWQVSLIRDSRQPICFICPKCLKKAIPRSRP